MASLSFEHAAVNVALAGLDESVTALQSRLAAAAPASSAVSAENQDLLGQVERHRATIEELRVATGCLQRRQGRRPVTGLPDGVDAAHDLVRNIEGVRNVKEETAAMDRLVAYLSAKPDVRIMVVGHADRLGTRVTNLAVSRVRADSVSALIAGGVGGDWISAVAHGDRVPVPRTPPQKDPRPTVASRSCSGAEGTDDREVAFTG